VLTKDVHLTSLLSRVIPSRAIGIEAEPADWEAALWPEEEAMVARAVAKRRREVAAGRTCARRALAQLGCAPAALLPDGQRVPQWPSGAIGSITHTHEYCAVAVAWQRDVRSIGLDAERAITTESRADIMRLVATPLEAAWLERLADEERGLGAALVFSAKEAFYKCQFPLTRQPLEFSELELELGVGHGALTTGASGELRGAFRAGTRAARDLPPLFGRYVTAGDLVVTAAFLLG